MVYIKSFLRKKPKGGITTVKPHNRRDIDESEKKIILERLKKIERRAEEKELRKITEKTRLEAEKKAKAKGVESARKKSIPKVSLKRRIAKAAFSELIKARKRGVESQKLRDKKSTMKKPTKKKK